MKLLEAVPNFSEGRSKARIARIAEALDSVEGAVLLHVDPEQDTHRSVMTLIGRPAAVEEALFRGISEAVECLDLRQHQGTHPRMGAVDVVPFVPWTGASMEDCVASAHRLGVRLGRELGLPGWFYGAAAQASENRYLHDIRRGQFEGLERKMTNKAADFGPSRPHPSAGATAVGAREILVAFNCTLSTRDVSIARGVAAEIREFQRVRRSVDGSVEHRQSLGLPGLRALGWFSERDGLAQVTMNLTNTVEAPPHKVLERLNVLCADQGVEVVGSELIGMIPEGLIEAAGEFFEPGTARPVEAGIRGLKLGVMHSFGPEERILEHVLSQRGSFS